MSVINSNRTNEKPTTLFCTVLIFSSSFFHHHQHHHHHPPLDFIEKRVLFLQIIVKKKKKKKKTGKSKKYTLKISAGSGWHYLYKKRKSVAKIYTKEQTKYTFYKFPPPYKRCVLLHNIQKMYVV